jgi:mono/diheme cytochrome c family protein
MISSGPSGLRPALPLLLVFAALLASTVRVRTDDPVSSSVRYTGEIMRIFDRKCAPCHGADNLAVPLSTYREVREWGRAIREEIVEQRMPPWSAARGYARFRNELALTSRETATILSWLDGGMPRGDDRDLPPPPAPEPRQPPQLRLQIPPQRVPAFDDHIVRRVSVDTSLAASRRVSGVIVRPDNRRVLRGALVFLEADGRTQWAGGWLPWQPALAAPASHAFTLPPAARLTVELHYRGDTKDLEDAPAIDLYFADPSPARGASDAAAIGELRVDAARPTRLTSAARVWAIVPSAGEQTSSLELTARRPNGAVDVLLWIPELRRDWPQALALQDATTLPAGTIVTLSVEPRGARAEVRLSLAPTPAASRATRSQTRTPAPPHR